MCRHIQPLFPLCLEDSDCPLTWAPVRTPPHLSLCLSSHCSDCFPCKVTHLETFTGHGAFSSVSCAFSLLSSDFSVYSCIDLGISFFRHYFLVNAFLTPSLPSPRTPNTVHLLECHHTAEWGSLFMVFRD